MPSLFVIQGRDQGQRFDLKSHEIALGRDISNTIQLHDTEVSRQHALMRVEADGRDYSLVDLDSSNGTFVNSQRVKDHPLKSGDRVQVGRTLMIYTGRDTANSEDLSDVVDIVVPAQPDAGSRILRSMTQQQSQLGSTDELGLSESPWLARARSNLQVMYGTALAVSHTLDIDQLLDRIMELIFEWVQADRGCIMLVDQESGELEPTVFHNRPGSATDDKLRISQTILDYVMENQEGVLTSDAREDDRWDGAMSIVKLGVREAICVPMQGRYGIVGVTYIDTYTPPGRAIQQPVANRFSEEHLKLMVAIGHQAALAVEDTSYYSALVQAERLAAIGQTIAGLSHHIKNILQGIRGGSYLIEEGLNNEQPDVVRKGWSIVERNQDRISHLVLDMLTFSKERKPDMVPTDLNRVAGEVVELMQTRAAELNVQLVFEPADEIPLMTFDPEGLHRAILNVVTNALDACGEVQDPNVQVSTRYVADSMKLQVLVQDNGEGIDPEDLAKIFAIFESRKGTRGTGLGLSVSQKIMQEHGGDIHVESQPGAGSCFTLELPAVLPSAEEEEESCQTRENRFQEDKSH